MTESSSQYSRDAAVAAIRSYYVFLTSQLPRLDRDDPPIICDPPPTGWPDLDATTLAPLGKTTTVTDLLRHLPYLGEDDEGSAFVAPYTRAIHYSGLDKRWRVDWHIAAKNLEPAGAGEVPAHVAVLTQGGRDASWVLLDTEKGTVTDFLQQELPERRDVDPDSPDYWRAYRTLPIAAFFEEWKDNFRRLEWVAMPNDDNVGVIYRYDRETDEVRNIYRAHDWPSDHFRREECREALLKWQEEERLKLLAKAEEEEEEDKDQTSE